MAKTRRTFTPGSKAQAVKPATEQGKSPAEVARDLDLGGSMPRAREQTPAKGGECAFPGEGNPPARERVRRRLRAESERPTRGRDTLKRATAPFAGGSS